MDEYFSIYNMVEPPKDYVYTDNGFNNEFSNSMITTDYTPPFYDFEENQANPFENGLVDNLFTFISSPEEVKIEEQPSEKSSEKPLEVSETKGDKFTNLSTFANVFNNAFRNALISNNMDPNWAPMFTAVAAFESDWGKKPSGSFNYGGIKVTNSQIQKGVSYTNKYTVDYIKGRGNVRHILPFRNFSSVLDYCNYKIQLMKKDRYKNVFMRYSPSLHRLAWEAVLRAGYGGGSETNIRNYMKAYTSIYNKVK